MYGVSQNMQMQQQVPQIGPQVPPNMSMGGSMMNPLSNNQPLQFNMSKGKPPMPLIKDNGDAMDESQNMVLSQSPEVTPPVDGMMSGMDAMGGGMGPGMSPWPPMMGHNMLGGMDPSMMYPQYGGFMGPMPPMEGPIQKEVITLKGCVLYPPPPNAPIPSTRERPPGCRTIFVGGLPELITDEMVREIFLNCGPICSIRMSKKNFAHIRFDIEGAIDRALYLSSYRIKIDNKDDKPNTGRIHVDFAQARDDLYEWECQQRMFYREERHRIRMEEDKLRPPSPPPIVHFSDHEASILLEKIKGDETFDESANVLVVWLERGDCNRKNASIFYSMVQSSNTHIRRIMNDKQQLDVDYNNMKIDFQNRRQGLMDQFEQVEKIFKATSKQKAWDHFSKAQRKNLDIWRKQANETIDAQRVEFFKERQEDEMDMSDNDEEIVSVKKPKKAITTDPAEYAQNAMIAWQSNQLNAENNSLKCQLEAYKNEVDLLKQETTTSDEGKEKQIKALQQALQGMQQQLIQSKHQIRKDAEEVTMLKAQVVHAKKMKFTEGDDNHAQTEIVVVSTIVEEKKDDAESSDDFINGAVECGPSLGSHTTLVEKEARILALLSTFLHVHPFGASLDYIWSYLQQLELHVRTSELEDVLERYPDLFKQSIFGVGASIEKRWKFIGFNVQSLSSVVLL